MRSGKLRVPTSGQTTGLITGGPITLGRSSRERRSLVAVACAAALGLTGLEGCVVNEPESPPRGIVVSGPPPAPMREERPAPPGPQALWVPGYWHWTGMQYAWIPGHWESPPPGRTWAAPIYTARDGKYFYENGGWQSPTAPAGNRNAVR